jgi:CBS-domain-containing membrane protein
MYNMPSWRNACLVAAMVTALAVFVYVFILKSKHDFMQAEPDVHMVEALTAASPFYMRPLIAMAVSIVCLLVLWLLYRRASHEQAPHPAGNKQHNPYPTRRTDTPGRNIEDFYAILDKARRLSDNHHNQWDRILHIEFLNSPTRLTVKQREVLNESIFFYDLEASRLAQNLQMAKKSVANANQSG